MTCHDFETILTRSCHKSCKISNHLACKQYNIIVLLLRSCMYHAWSLQELARWIANCLAMKYAWARMILVRIWYDHSLFLQLLLALICHESCVQRHEPFLNLVRIWFDHSSFLHFASCTNLSWIKCANAWAMSESCQNLVWSFFVLAFCFLS